MRTIKKKLPLLLSLFVMLFLAAGSNFKNISAHTIPDFSGNWDIMFYDASGKMEGKKTVAINERGSFSDKVILNINNVIYNTEISATLSKQGKVQDGVLTDTDKLEMTGVLTGNFSTDAGQGEWKNYYGSSGTWKAVRSENKKNR